MKKTAIRIALICFTLIASVLIFTSCAKSDGTLKYEKVKGGYEVVGLDKNAGEEIEIPASFKGKDVISIADNAFYSAKIKKISIPSSIASVGNQAFAYCERLEGVYISDIDAYASIEFASAESNPLYSAHKLYINGTEATDVEINSDKIGSFAFAGCSSIQTADIKSATSIGGGAFSYCSALCEISLSDSLESIGASAFSHATSLISITLPDSVEEMSHSVFAYCSSLESATLPSDLMEISDRTFLNCEALKTIALPDSTLTVGDSAFSGCSTLDNVKIPKKTTEILDFAFFNCASLKAFEIAEESKLKTIGKSAFRGCYSIVDLSLMNASSLTLIDDSAFQFCTNLTNITVPSSIKTLGDHAFSGCDSLALTDVGGIGYIGNSVDDKLILVKCIDDKLTSAKITIATKFICSGAFEHHNTLATVIITSDSGTGVGVIGVGSNAFAFCPKLTSITFGKSVKTIGDFAVMGCKSLKTIKYGGNSTAWKSVTRGTNWTYGAGTSTITYS